MACRRGTENRNGFTLIEVTVVIAIIGILALLGSNMNFAKNSDTEKAGAFAAAVSSLIRTEVLHTVSGKGVSQNGSLAYPGSTRVSLSKSLFSVGYYSGNTLLQSGPQIANPFFWDTSYSVRSIRAIDWSATYVFNGSDVATIELADWKDTIMSYSGAAAWNVIILEVELGYHDAFKTLTYDRRSNVVSIR